MKVKSFAVVSLLLTATAFGTVASTQVGCGAKDTEETANKEAPEQTTPGAVLARGVMGAPSMSENPTGQERAMNAVANEIIAEIEARFPGELDRIHAEIRSKDADRIIAAKVARDKLINDTARGDNESLRRRVSKNQTARSALAQTQTQTIRPLDLLGSSGGQPLVNDGGSLVDGGVQLLCEHPRGADGQLLQLGRGANGRFGDDRTGFTGRLADIPDLVDTTDLWLPRTLDRIDRGELTPDPSSRLGAYAATRGFPSGTVGAAVHRAIGAIYLIFGNYGQERIGSVFNSPEAQALYGQPVTSCASMQMAHLEYQYWRDVQAEDGWSPGGQMGSMFNPSARNFIQHQIFDD